MLSRVKVLLIGLGGFVGANARYWLGAWLDGRFLPMPWPTFVINALGSLLIGIVVGSSPREGWRLLVAVGLLGGFTTFSTFSLEAFTLLEAGERGQALLYVLASVVVGVVLAGVGMTLGRALAGRP